MAVIDRDTSVVWRLWSQYAEDVQRKSVLHGVRSGRNSAELGHVPVHRGTTQHVRHLHTSLRQALPALQAPGSFQYHVRIYTDLLVYMLDYTCRKHFVVEPLFWRTFTFAICYRPSVYLSVCLSSVTFVRPTQAVQIFGNICTALGTLAILVHWKFHGDHPRETPAPGELNTRGVGKYSDFGPIDGYISETVQNRR